VLAQLARITSSAARRRPGTPARSAWPIRNAIVGRDAVLTRAVLDGALLGNAVVVNGFEGSATLGDHSELNGKERS